MSAEAQDVHRRKAVVGYVLKMYPRFSETFIVSEILAREARGEEIVIFSLRPSTDTRFHPELARVKAPVVHISRPNTSGRFWQHLGQAGSDEQLLDGLRTVLPELLRHSPDDAVQAVSLARLAREHKVTHLHAHFASVATTVARTAGQIAGIPYSFTAHAKDIFHADIDQLELEQKFADAHHAITISAYNLADLRRRFPEATSTLKLVRNGLELERFPYAPRSSTAPHTPTDSHSSTDPRSSTTPRTSTGQLSSANRRGAPRLLSVGRLVEKKGLHLLIDAVARLREAGTCVEADIAGDGPMAADLQQQIDRLGLQDQVRLLGARTQAEVRELLGTHDVFVAPFVVGQDGNADGLPTVLLEAMARGIRCVAADVTAVGEVIRTGETGWLVPSGDAAALTDAVCQAVRTDSAAAAEHRRLTDNARALVEELYVSHRQAAALNALVTATRTIAQDPLRERDRAEGALL